MGLAEVLPFIRGRMSDLGYTEHNQPFEPDEIGGNIVDNAFHVEAGSVSASEANQLAHSFIFPFTVRIYKVGYSDILSAYDAVFEDADKVLADLLEPSVRLGQSFIKNITPSSIQPTALSVTNDNVIVLNLTFTARLELCYKT